MPPIYLDNNATTRTDPEVVAAMLPFFGETFGNASSTHAFGAGVATAVKAARGDVKALVGAASDAEIVFTSGGTESDNAAILSALAADPGRDEIVTSAVEHPAVLALLAHLEKTRGTRVTVVGVDRSGRIDIAAYRAALGPRTALATVMWANNETGTIFPVADLAALAHEAGALFHTDAVQAAGRVRIDVASATVDMLSLSGHKFHAPKGVGALYVRKGVPFAPLIRGGRQERGRRAGTENVPGIVGLGRAAALATMRMADDVPRIASLRDRLEAGILAMVPAVEVLGDPASRLPGTLAFAFDGLDSEAILFNLEKEGIAASSGSACASGSMEPSHVLKAMAVPPTALEGAIRLCLSRETTDAEIDRVLAVLPPIVRSLQEASPFWQERHGAEAGVPA
ncbi:cysteine desulfurase NifS [Acuticoccus sediminis]|uniref:cysteine desulfurase NifS n=1 Tax=Acuticoccus sediminis TaxID=2184697 RepID=UPI001CFCD106|nr:cysteine desulfurase NifS [Acuticoccus sediminis]